MQKKIKAKNFIIFCCFFLNINPSISQTETPVKLTSPIIIPLSNLDQYEKVSPIPPIVFQDSFGNKINLKEFFGNLIIINFWATWCKPCKEEMPSLDRLYQNENFEKTRKFFSNLNIKKLQFFFDAELNFAKKLKLRNFPTTVLISKKGEKFARVTGQ